MKFEAVVGEADVGGEFGVGRFVVEVVRDVGEVGAFGGEQVDGFDGLREVHVGRVGFAAESVEDEDVEVFEEWQAYGGDVARVSEVGHRADAIARDGLLAVGDGNALEGGAEERDGCAAVSGDAVHDDAGAGGVAVCLAEGVFEDALDDFCGGVVSEERKAFGEAEAERTKVVHAEDVVGVAMCVEHGIDGHDAFADGLRVEVGAGVDQDIVAVI